MLSLIRSGLSTENIIITVFSLLVIIFVAFPIHECAHGVMAKLLGDDTAYRQGRMTLNPLSHIDPMGAIAMFLFGIGWARPVPVNVSNCRKVKQKTAMALVALAGPLSNILLSFVILTISKVYLFLILNGVIPSSDVATYVYYALIIIIELDLYLAVFNLLPIPPFDGSRIFLLFLNEKWYFQLMRYERYIMIGVLLLLWTGLLRGPLRFLSDMLFVGLDFMTGFVGLIFTGSWM
jgi:Zn-dependent protease